MEWRGLGFTVLVSGLWIIFFDVHSSFFCLGRLDVFSRLQQRSRLPLDGNSGTHKVVQTVINDGLLLSLLAQVGFGFAKFNNNLLLPSTIALSMTITHFILMSKGLACLLPFFFGSRSCSPTKWKRNPRWSCPSSSSASLDFSVMSPFCMWFRQC